MTPDLTLVTRTRGAGIFTPLLSMLKKGGKSNVTCIRQKHGAHKTHSIVLVFN